MRLVLLAAAVAAAVLVPHKRPTVRLSYFAPFLSPGGFSAESWDFAVGLSRIPELDLQLIHHGDTYDEAHVASLPEHHRALAPLFRRRDVAPDRLVLCHSSPDAMSLPQPKWATPPALECPPPHRHGPVVARAMYETDRLPSGWRERLARVEEVWVPTHFHKEVFERGGLSKVAVVGESVDTEAFDPAKAASLSEAEVRAHTVYETRPPRNNGTAVCRIVSSGKWEERKGFEALVRSFRTAFAGAPDSAELLILSRPFHDDSTWSQRVEPLLGGGLSGARVAVLENLPPPLLPGFYLLGAAFALATSGEGWGRPFAEAMAMERVVIATNFSGQTEYMRDGENALLARFALVDRGDGHRWAAADEAHLAQLLADACSPQQTARMRDIGRRARASMVASYSVDALAATIFQRLKHLQRQER